MEGENVASSSGSRAKRAVKTVSILVVDDDAVCLSILAITLRKLHCLVTAVKHPNDALWTLRTKAGEFDLVLSDVHMPDMDGIQLQHTVTKEFNLPVVLMSADERESVMLQGLKAGAKSYMTKPLASDDLEVIWQHACQNKMQSRVTSEDHGEVFPVWKTPSDNNGSHEAIPTDSESSASEAMSDHSEDSDKNTSRKEAFDERSGECSQAASRKKQKINWTDALHCRFLEAIHSIGYNRACPSKILARMNDPQLRIHNVASHLQKYRLFLRKAADGAQHSPTVSRLEWITSNNFPPVFIPSSSSSTENSSPLLSNCLKDIYNQNRRQFPGSNGAFYPSPERGQSRLGTSGSSFMRTTSTSLGLLHNSRNADTYTTNFHPPLRNHKTNYVGLNMSHIQHFLESGNSSDATMSYPINPELRCTSTVPLRNENAINIDQLAGGAMVSSSYQGPNAQFGGEHEYDVRNECQMLSLSSASGMENVESGGGIQLSVGSPLYDLDELVKLLEHEDGDDNPASQDQIQRSVGSPLYDLNELVKLLVEDNNHNPTFQDQNQNVGTNVTASGFPYGNTSGSNIHAPYSNQAPDEVNCDEFLESLLAPRLAEDNHTIEGSKVLLDFSTNIHRCL